MSEWVVAASSEVDIEPSYPAGWVMAASKTLSIRPEEGIPWTWILIGLGIVAGGVGIGLAVKKSK